MPQSIAFMPSALPVNLNSFAVLSALKVSGVSVSRGGAGWHWSKATTPEHGPDGYSPRQEKQSDINRPGRQAWGWDNAILWGYAARVRIGAGGGADFATLGPVSGTSRHTSKNVRANAIICAPK